MVFPVPPPSPEFRVWAGSPRQPFGLRSRSASRWLAVRSIWDRGVRTTTNRRPPPKNRQIRSVRKTSATQRATPPAARFWRRSGKNDEALAEFDTALALDPYNAQALYGRGLIYQSQNQHQQAIEDFTTANGLAPQRVEPLLGRATSYLAVDKAKEAAADLDEAVQADPNSAQAWTTRGQAYERLGDKAKATASYGRAVALRPKDDAARTGLARTGG